jgi:hypothetical protein
MTRAQIRMASFGAAILVASAAFVTMFAFFNLLVLLIIGYVIGVFIGTFAGTCASKTPGFADWVARLYGMDGAEIAGLLGSGLAGILLAFGVADAFGAGMYDIAVGISHATGSSSQGLMLGILAGLTVFTLISVVIGGIVSAILRAAMHFRSVLTFVREVHSALSSLGLAIAVAGLVVSVGLLVVSTGVGGWIGVSTAGGYGCYAGGMAALPVTAVILAIVAPSAAGLRVAVSGWVRDFRGSRSGGLWRASGHVAAAWADGSVTAGVGWRTMLVAARLMPPASGQRWIAEAESFLAEAPPGLQRRAIASYLAGAAQVIVVSWAVAAARQARLARRGPASR